jgi:hypothetical protein
MQINNWTSLLKSKRLSKTPRDINNDLIIIGTNTVGSLKKQDTWQPYAMTLADLASAIGGGGGGVSFSLLAGDFTILQENGIVQDGAFTPAEDSTITIGAVSIPNGLNWEGAWSNLTADYAYNDVVSTIVGGIYYTYWMYNDAANPPAGAPLPIFPATSNTYWAQLGLQGPAGADGADGANGTDGSDGTDGTNGVRTAVLEMFQWSATAPTTYPSGNSTYTWNTGSFTAPTLNGWSIAVPAPVQGQFLWRVRQIFVDTNTTLTSTVAWTANTNTAITYAGQDGAATVQSFSALRTANYTLAAGTKGTMEMISTFNQNIVITIPSMNNTQMPIGAQVLFSWDVLDTAQINRVSFLAGANSTIKVPDNMLYLRSLYSTACLTKQSYDGLTGTTVWYLTGDLTNVF